MIEKIGNMKQIHIMFALVLMLASANTASAVLIKEAYEIPYQVNESDRIIVGTVTDVQSFSYHTIVTIEVAEWLKNPPPKNLITVQTDVGTIDTGIESDEASFTVNESMILMLKDVNINEYRFAVVFGQLGKHTLSDRDAVLQELPPKPAVCDWRPPADRAQNNNISTEEALHRVQLQDIAGELDAELSVSEPETFAGLWVEHNPKFKIVVQFTRDGGETIKPYLKLHTELANIVEVRTAKMLSLADLQKAQANASDSARALDIPVGSGINVYNNNVELYVTKTDRSRFDDAVQRGDIQLPDVVRVITVEANALVVMDENPVNDVPANDTSPNGIPFMGATGTFMILIGAVLLVHYRKHI